MVLRVILCDDSSDQLSWNKTNEVFRKAMSDATPESNEELRPHSVTAKAIHWGFIIVFIYAVAKQLDEVEELEDFSLLQYEMGFASFFLVLLVARFVYMHSTRPTVLPSNTPKRTLFWARAVHLGMYLSLALVAFTGLWIGGLYWSGIKSGIAMDIPLILHDLTVKASVLLIVGHISAAIFHRRKGDGIWNSMVPFWKEGGK